MTGLTAGPTEGPTEGPVIAAVDCGTNTIKLLIARDGAPLERASRIVRLGEGVDATGRLAPSALERAFSCLDEYADIIGRYPVSRIRFCATSATRDSSNASEFAVGVRERLGVVPEVLSGEEEAALAFAGAVGNLRHVPVEPVTVFDVGGGSTELIQRIPADAGHRLESHSMDIGSVRLHERHLHSDPPTATEVEACVVDIEAQLDASPVNLSAAGSLVGVAGTFLTLAAGALGLTAYDTAVVDQAVIGVADLHTLTSRLVGLSVADRIELGFVGAGRADVIGAGALIVSCVVARTQVPTVTASEADILDGIAASISPTPTR